MDINSYEEKYLAAMTRAIVKRDNCSYVEARKQVLEAKRQIEDEGKDQDDVMEALLHDIPNSDTEHVDHLYQQIIDNDLLEDRREYDLDEYMASYGLTREQAEQLDGLVQAKCEVGTEHFVVKK